MSDVFQTHDAGSDLLRPDVVATQLHVSVATLARWRQTPLRGPIYTRIGSKIYYRAADVETYVRQRRMASVRQPAIG